MIERRTLVAGLRRWWRAGRQVPVVGAAVRAGDRVLWTRRIVRSGLVDAEYYAAQRGWRVARGRRAVRDYVRHGFRDGLSLNVLIDEIIAGRDLPESGRVPALYAYLVSDRGTVRVHPWWSAPTYMESTDAEGQGPVELAWARGVDTPLTIRIGGVERVMSLGALRNEALVAAREWHSPALSEPKHRSGQTRALIRYLQPSDVDFDRKINSAVELIDDTNVIIVGVGVGATQWVSLRVAVMLYPELDVLACAPGATFARALDLAADRLSNDGVVAVIDPRAELSSTTMRRLLDAADTRVAVMPAPLRLDGSLAGLGAGWVRGKGWYRVLSEHPVEDLATFEGRTVDVPALTGRTFALGVGALRASRAAPHQRDDGFDAERRSTWLRSKGMLDAVQVLTDLTCPEFAAEAVFAPRARRMPGSLGAHDATLRIREICREARFETEGWKVSRGIATPILRWMPAEPGMRRWAIKICAPSGPLGDVWGDRHFARGLASALRRRGQFAIVDAFDARQRTTGYLDEVTLVVRGPYRISPPRHGVRIEWIISHPDQITRQEVSEFDIVFAASERWAASAHSRLGVPVLPLLECTDVDLFHPSSSTRGEDIVFVGTARGIARPSVVVPLRAGIPVKVYGPDWRTYIPASAIIAPTIPNESLPHRYATASIVLNDHWPAMRLEGFMAMRPFDVIAAGGRVVSEDVDGLAAIFEGAVVTYSEEQELVEILTRDPSEIFPDEETLAKISEKIRRDHSFDARVGEIMSVMKGNGE